MELCQNSVIKIKDGSIKLGVIEDTLIGVGGLIDDI